MTTHIKNAEYRRFWEAVWLECAKQAERTNYGFDLIETASDMAAASWASRFADPDTLADIEANEMKRGQG